MSHRTNVEQTKQDIKSILIVGIEYTVLEVHSLLDHKWGEIMVRTALAELEQEKFLRVRRYQSNLLQYRVSIP